MATVFNALPKKSGIYLIFNRLSNKGYIGQSVNMYNRLKVHVSLLERAKKHNGYALKKVNLHLLASWKKYGKAAFVCEALEILSRDSDSSLEDFKIKLSEAEQYWIDYFKTLDIPLYNTKEFVSNSSYGAVTKPEIKLIQSKASRGANNPSSLLTEKQAIALLTTDSSLTRKQAALKYNVTESCIKDLWLRRTWKHLLFSQVISPNAKQKISLEKRNNIISDLSPIQTIDNNTLCEKYKIHINTLQAIKRSLGLTSRFSKQLKKRLRPTAS